MTRARFYLNDAGVVVAEAGRTNETKRTVETLLLYEIWRELRDLVDAIKHQKRDE